MKRRIISIDAEKCNGCGLCVEACHEGALALVDGKAKLMRDDYCDGLGDCLPACPQEAISFEEREAAPYDEAAVAQHLTQRQEQPQPETLPCGCPGTMTKSIERREAPPAADLPQQPSRLQQWPVQIKLIPANAPYLNQAKLLIAADCTAFAYGNFHERFMRDKITLVGCPKLDQIDYAEKLTDILRENEIKSLTVVRMEVPCCGGIVEAVKRALVASGKQIPWQVVVVATDGRIVEE